MFVSSPRAATLSGTAVPDKRWLEDDYALGPGDSVYLDKDVVHGSYNDFDEPAQLAVVLAPAIGDGGYVAVDVSADEPWASWR